MENTLQRGGGVMLRVEEFQHQNKTCYQKELEGCPVEITEQSYQATLGKLEYTRHLKRWKGRHLLVIGDEVEDVDESLVTDCGPKLGVSVACTPHREVPFTEEEREAGRRHVIEVATQLMIRAGIW